jgi:hypothetical protein
MNYKAPDNSLHFIEPEFAHLLPAGSVPITEEEADALRPVPPPPTPLELLAKLDADNALTQRNLRETIMLMAEAFKVATNGAVDLSQVRGVQMVYAVEAEAEVLRAQL